jgi:putative N-acetylmannosamine-6-phosphate epimerase
MNFLKDILNFNCVDTRWQEYITHLHTSNKQNNTINFEKVRGVHCYFVLTPGICLKTEEKARKTLSQGSRSVTAGTMITEYTEQNMHTKGIHKYKNT